MYLIILTWALAQIVLAWVSSSIFPSFVFILVVELFILNILLLEEYIADTYLFYLLFLFLLEWAFDPNREALLPVTLEMSPGLLSAMAIVTGASTLRFDEIAPDGLSEQGVLISKQFSVRCARFL